MIDGITVKTSIKNLDEWLELTQIKTWLAIDNATGEVRSKKRGNKIVTKRRGNWEEYFLEIIEVSDLNIGSSKFYLNIRGSLHKNAFSGMNWQSFNCEALQCQIKYICKSLFIVPENARISRLEFGINIVIPFNISHFLNHNVIDYKGRVFNKYKRDKKGLELGLFCEFKQYSIKLYDKGKQYDLPCNMMRFEKKCIKMQVLKESRIIHLSDLLDRQKIFGLKSLLLKAWDDILINDIENEETLSHKISDKEYSLLLNGKASKYWHKIKQINVGQYNYNRGKYRRIVKEYGLNYQSMIRSKISETWDNLFEISTNLPLGFNKKVDEFTLKIKGNKLESIANYCFPCKCDNLFIVKYN